MAKSSIRRDSENIFQTTENHYSSAPRKKICRRAADEASYDYWLKGKRSLNRVKMPVSLDTEDKNEVDLSIGEDAINLLNFALVAGSSPPVSTMATDTVSESGEESEGSSNILAAECSREMGGDEEWNNDTLATDRISHRSEDKELNDNALATDRTNEKNKVNTCESSFTTFRPDDVLCGRGLGSCNQTANVLFRELVHKYGKAYRLAVNSTLRKTAIANYVIGQIRPGRFLRREKIENTDNTCNGKILYRYTELSPREVMEKTCQALRDASIYDHSKNNDRNIQSSASFMAPSGAFTNDINLMNAANEAHFEAHPQFFYDKQEMYERQIENYKEAHGFKDLGLGNLNSNDVLLGRGGFTNHFPGNRSFRQLIIQNQLRYYLASKASKPLIADQILKIVRSRNGRFLKKNENDVWIDVGDNRAKEKVAQALREKGPEFKKLYGHFTKQQQNAVSFLNEPEMIPGAYENPAGTLLQSKLPTEQQLNAQTSFTYPTSQWVPPSPEHHQHVQTTSFSNASFQSNTALPKQCDGNLYQVSSISDVDVLCGRGAAVNRHKGNIFFRNLVALKRDKYKGTESKKLKNLISRGIVQKVLDNGGRFLKKKEVVYTPSNMIDHDSAHVWYDVGIGKAIEKTSQALRETDQPTKLPN